MGKTEHDYYQSLWIIATAINLAHPSENVLRSIVEHVANAMGAKGCSLMLLTPDQAQLLHTASYGLSDSYIRKGPISAGRSISGRTFWMWTSAGFRFKSIERTKPFPLKESVFSAGTAWHHSSRCTRCAGMNTYLSAWLWMLSGSGIWL